MKLWIAGYLALLTGFSGCDNREPFLGNWEITEYVTIQAGDTVVTDQGQIKERGMYWNMAFLPDGSYEQEARGDSTRQPEQHLGSWHLDEEILVVQIPSEQGRPRPIRYRYERDGDRLMLERDILFPRQTLHLTFTRKE